MPGAHVPPARAVQNIPATINDLGVPGEPPGTFQEAKNNQNSLFLPHEQDFRLIPFDSAQFRPIPSNPFNSVQFRLKFSRQRLDPDAVHDTTRPTYWNFSRRLPRWMGLHAGVSSCFASELSKGGAIFCGVVMQRNTTDSETTIGKVVD